MQTHSRLWSAHFIERFICPLNVWVAFATILTTFFSPQFWLSSPFIHAHSHLMLSMPAIDYFQAGHHHVLCEVYSIYHANTSVSIHAKAHKE